MGVPSTGSIPWDSVPTNERGHMAKPTYEDGAIVLKCAELFNAMDLNRVSAWVFADDFPKDHAEFLDRCPPGSEGFRDVHRFLGYFETVATLWKNDLFNEKLLFDWLFIPWERVGPIALGEREARGVTRLYENFEKLGRRQAKVFKE